MKPAYPPTHLLGAAPDLSSLNTSIIKAVICAGIMALSLWTTPALAWGSQGHQVIAGLALSQLSPKARAEVDKLLALEPGETLVSVSTWADEHRSPATARWHYVNFPLDSCSYLPQRDCPDGASPFVCGPD